jgi:propionyl-CoA carboxylase beta chain
VTHQEAIQRARERREQMLAGGGPDKIEAQHAKGKLTARERIELLVDPGSFIEQQPYITVRATEFGLAERKYLGDGVVSGTGKVGGRQVFLFSQDFTVLGGSLGEMHAERIA